MRSLTTLRLPVNLTARAARGEVEAAMGASVSDWPWSRPLSLWIDALVLIEESAA